MSKIDDEIKEIENELKKCKALKERLRNLKFQRKFQNMSPNEKQALAQLMTGTGKEAL